jgi:hypothetical protein
MSPAAIVRNRARCAAAVVTPSVHVRLPSSNASFNVAPGAIDSVERVVAVIGSSLRCAVQARLWELTAAARFPFPAPGRLHRIYRLEHDQGFFVKQGDGAADVKPIANLYKSQVYQLAAFLGVPEEIRVRRPTTDTYPLEQSQEEFYFGLSLEQTDLCLYARDHGLSPQLAAPAVGLTPEQVERVYRSIDAKRAAARYLHEPPVLIDPHCEVR